MVLKILHVIPYFAAAYGGPVQGVRDIARMQLDCGIDAEIATTTANGATELTTEQFAGERVAIHCFERTFPRGWFHSRALGVWLTRHARDYHALHLHVPFTHPFLCAARAAQRAGIPYAVSPHGMLDPWSLRHKAWKKTPYLALIEGANLARARLIHVTSVMEADGLRAHGYAERVRVVPLGVALPSEMTRLASAQLRLLYLSRLHPVKGLPTLLHAVAQVSGLDVRLTIAGEGDPRYAESLRAMVSKLGLTNKVDFAGHLDDDAKCAAWRAHDVFVLPSLHENFSLSTVEAMASGMPAIVSDQIGVAGRIRATGAGAVVPCQDPQALALAIYRMRDHTARQHMGAQARRLVEQEYATRVVGKRYAELAQELSGRKRNGAR